MNLATTINLHCVIVKQGDKYCVKSEDKSKNLGCKPSKEAAKRRLQQVEYFKNLKGGGVGSGRKKLSEDEKQNKRLRIARYDPRQRSLYGPEHEKELQQRKSGTR